METVLAVSSDFNSNDEIFITKETTGTEDIFSALATLDESDCDIISGPSAWLTCDIVQAIQVLLQEVNPLPEALQCPTLRRLQNFDVVSGQFLHILHTGSDHCVCVSSIECLPGL